MHGYCAWVSDVRSRTVALVASVIWITAMSGNTRAEEAALPPANQTSQSILLEKWLDNNPLDWPTEERINPGDFFDPCLVGSCAPGVGPIVGPVIPVPTPCGSLASCGPGVSMDGGLIAPSN